MSNFEKNMQEIFDVPAELIKSETTQLIPVEKKPEETTTDTSNLNKDLDQDYEETRKTLKDLAKSGTEAIETLLQIAKDTEHPRAFEVVATLMKTTAEVNEKLMVMQKAVRDMKNINTKKDAGVSVDKAIFVGSTAELNKLLKGKSNGDTE